MIAEIGINHNGDIQIAKRLLDAAYAGRGQIENGIFPKGLIGHNDALEEIPYDPEAARQLLKEAGYQKASLSVQKENYAVKMYRNLGFTIIGENDEEYLMAVSLN